MTLTFHRTLCATGIALVIAAMAYGGAAVAEIRKSEPKAACTSLKDEFACMGRDDCTWRSASVNAKTGKETRRASCAKKPAAKKASKKDA